MLAALLVSFGFISTAAMTDHIFLEPDKITHKYPGTCRARRQTKRVRINAGRVGRLSVHVDGSAGARPALASRRMEH